MLCWDVACRMEAALAAQLKRLQSLAVIILAMEMVMRSTSNMVLATAKFKYKRRLATSMLAGKSNRPTNDTVITVVAFTAFLGLAIIRATLSAA